jgi:hypothetical protein
VCFDVDYPDVTGQATQKFLGGVAWKRSVWHLLETDPSERVQSLVAPWRDRASAAQALRESCSAGVSVVDYR